MTFHSFCMASLMKLQKSCCERSLPMGIRQKSSLLSTAKLGDHGLGSVRPSVRPSVCLSIRPSTKSNKSHYQSKVFVCVSIISGRMQLIARMRSAFNLYYNFSKIYPPSLNWSAPALYWGVHWL